MKTDYESRVQALEDQGLTRSDAQGVVDAEDLQFARSHGPYDPIAGIIRDTSLPAYGTINLSRFVSKLADHYQQADPIGFNRERFIALCGKTIGGKQL